MPVWLGLFLSNILLFDSGPFLPGDTFMGSVTVSYVSQYKTVKHNEAKEVHRAFEEQSLLHR